MSDVVRSMSKTDSGLDVKDRIWLKLRIPDAFTGWFAQATVFKTGLDQEYSSSVSSFKLPQMNDNAFAVLNAFF